MKEPMRFLREARSMARRQMRIIPTAGIVLAAHVLSNGSVVVLGLLVATIMYRRMSARMSRARRSSILAIWISLLPVSVASLPGHAASERVSAGSVAPNPNFVIAIAGIDSSSHLNDDGTMSGDPLYGGQLQSLGYDAERVFFFSYAGTSSGAAGSWTLHTPYPRGDTYRSIPSSADRLATLIDLVHARDPHRGIDLVAHSIGGLVARYYLTYLYHRASCGDTRIEHFVTFATPHLGAPLAGFLGGLGSHGVIGRAALAVVAGVTKLTRLGPDPRVEAVREMAPNSSLMRSLNADWDPSIASTTSISIDNDMFVPSSRAQLRGSRTYTVPGPRALTFLLHPRDRSLVAAHGEIVSDARAWAAAGEGLHAKALGGKECGD